MGPRDIDEALRERRGVLMPCMVVVAWSWTLASLQRRRDRARQVFTDQAGIACTTLCEAKREAFGESHDG